MKRYSNKQCKTCMYRAGESYENVCDYILITGHMRGCPVEECDKYVRKERQRKKPVILIQKASVRT